MQILYAVARTVRDASEIGVLFPFRHVARAMHRERIHVHVRGFGRIGFRLRGSDVQVLRQVFKNREYDLTRLPQHATILAHYRAILASGRQPVFVDAGANIGASALWFSKMFPDAIILAVEPNGDNASLCRTNTAQHGRIRVVEAALGSALGHARIANPGADSWGLQVERVDEGRIPITTVPALVDTVPNGTLFGVKIDIEGFEAEVFSDNTQWLEEARFLILEPHDWMLPDRKSSRAFQRAMSAHDFDLLISGENLVYVRGP